MCPVIEIIAGARPNFMKVAALFAVCDRFPELGLQLIHTGQHYDFAMSDIFFSDLNLPVPAHHMEVGSGSHGVQTARIMERYEEWVLRSRPDMCVVVGDVNSTVACALVSAKLGIPVAHVEAGLRSFDRTMPEEINRVVTDSISDLLFVTEPSGIDNLAREGRPAESIHYVGNVMIDTLLRLQSAADAVQYHGKLGMRKGEYAIVTMHRPSNVDPEDVLAEIVDQILWLGQKIKVVFPVHPRTRNRLQETMLWDRLIGGTGVILIDPVGYLESLSLISGAKLVVTDSGGMQEETTALGVPCITLRENTERPITLTYGTNVLIHRQWGIFRNHVAEIFSLKSRFQGNVPLWDGQAGVRILKVISRFLFDSRAG
jgi:UDP-N-acetylglucosamine 2-epimerase (non-hydrolysing)